MKKNLNWKTSLIVMMLLIVGTVSSMLAATISGTITDETSQPVDHSMVQLAVASPNGNPGMSFRTTLTDSTGAYTFINIPGGDYFVSAVAPEYVRSFYTDPVTGDVLVVEVDADDQEIVGIDIQLTPQNDPPPHHNSVSGRVFNQDNLPVQGIPVGIVSINDLNIPYTGPIFTTNMMGYYNFHDVLPGTYKTCAFGPDTTPMAYSAEFTVTIDSVIDSVNIYVNVTPPPPTGSISGNVIGLQTNPMMMLNIGLVTLDNPTVVLPGLTGHANMNGYYVIRNIPVGTYKSCVLGPDMAPVAYSEPVTVIANEMVENVDIVYGTIVGFSVSGTVVNALNEPVQYGIVVLRSVPDSTYNHNNMHYMNRTVHLDSTGSYVFINVPAGAYIVSVWTHMSPVVFYPSTFDITQAVPVVVVDENLTGINITIPNIQNYTISGYVRDAVTELPLEGIRVRTDRMGFHHFPVQDPMFNNEFHTLTDVNGFYSLSLPFGRYTLAAIDTTHFYRVQFYDHAPNPFSATVIVLDHDYTNVNFDLIERCDSLQCSISGTITENGDPVTYPVMVVAVSSDEDWEDSTISGSDGTYTINHIRPGNYYVVAYSLYTAPVYYNNVLTWDDADEIVVGGPVTGINFNLINTNVDGPNNVNGTVTDTEGTGVDNVIVMLTNNLNQVIGFARTDASGSYTINNVPSDIYTVTATKPGLTTVTQSLSLIGDENLDIIVGAPTANDDNFIPVTTTRISNYPNPFNPNTTISFDISKDASVSVKVFNVKGQVIKNLLNNNVKAGNHTLSWDGTDDNGKHVSTGIYLVRLQGQGFQNSHKMTLMK